MGNAIDWPRHRSRQVDGVAASAIYFAGSSPVTLLDNLFVDLRYSLRVLRKSRGFVAIASLTLGLGIGANTVVFSVTNALLLQHLPVQSPERLVHIGETDGRTYETKESYAFYQYLRSQTDAFADVVGFSDEEAVLTSADHSEFVRVGVVTGNYFDVLGVKPVLGRTIKPEDDRTPGAHPVVVLNHAFWKRRFGADRDVLGKTIPLVGGSFTVIGVCPRDFLGFRLEAPPDLWVPLMMTAQVRLGFQPWTGRNFDSSHWLDLVGRLKPGVGLKRAQRIADTAYQKRQESLFGSAREGGRAPGKVRLVLLPAGRGLSSLRNQLSEPLFILLATVGVVLLISCTNVAGMLVSRAISRSKEVAVRLALGSSRGRLLQQLMIENMLLSLLGGAAGLLVAFVVSDWLLGFLLASPSQQSFVILPDVRVLGFGLLLALGAVLLFGLATALQSTKPDLASALQGEGARSTGMARRFRLRNVLVVTQIALCLVILVGGGLLLRSLTNLRRVDPGFTKDNVLLLQFFPPQSGYNDQQSRAFYQELVQRVSVQPAVTAASFASMYSFNGSSERTEVKTRSSSGSGEALQVETTYVGPGYFKTLGIQLIRGRDFGANDIGRRKVAIISEVVARRLFGDSNPLGESISWGAETFEILGVVKDVKYLSLRSESPGILYIPDAHGYTTLIVRGSSPLRNALAVVQREAQAIGKNVPVRQVTTLEQQVDYSLRQERLLAMVASFLGVLALLIAAVGLYGMLAYFVTLRSREFGIRLALGSKPTDLVRLVLRQTTLMAGGGVAIGLPAALALTHFLSSMLYGVSPLDAFTIGASVMVIAAAALIASYAPAQRAVLLDPAVALRSE